MLCMCVAHGARRADSKNARGAFLLQLLCGYADRFGAVLEGRNQVSGQSVHSRYQSAQGLQDYTEGNGREHGIQHSGAGRRKPSSRIRWCMLWLSLCPCKICQPYCLT